MAQWEWAAGLNPNPFKRSRQLRNLSSDHAAVTPCSRPPLSMGWKSKSEARHERNDINREYRLEKLKQHKQTIYD